VMEDRSHSVYTVCISIQYLGYAARPCSDLHLQVVHVVLDVSFLDHLRNLPVPFPCVRGRVEFCRQYAVHDTRLVAGWRQPAYSPLTLTMRVRRIPHRSDRLHIQRSAMFRSSNERLVRLVRLVHVLRHATDH